MYVIVGQSFSRVVTTPPLFPANEVDFMVEGCKNDTADYANWEGGYFGKP